jgi:hypothetical protein
MRPDRPIDLTLLGEFEQGLNVRWPEKSRIPARVLGYGEISTVLEIQAAPAVGLAYKRMPMFRDEAEAARYEALYREYVDVLQNQIGIQVVPGELVKLRSRQGKLIVYMAQGKLPPESIGHRAIRQLAASDVRRLVQAALHETKKVFDFNRAHARELEVGFDGQISNWAIVGFEATAPGLPDEIRLAYLDTSTPLMQKSGREQLDAELFLRSAPFFLVWLLRLLYLEEVLTRYYDLRRVVLDLIANFYKEQRADLIPALIEMVNESFAAETQDGRFKPLSAQEVASYYQQDAQLWSVYLAARKVDRFLRRLIGNEYPYILPEKIVR